MTIVELIVQALMASDQFWFVQEFKVIEQTDKTVTGRFTIASDLFVQVFLSERSGRFSLALVSPAGRLYGRDREYGLWHRHPFGDADQHEPTSAGMSLHPIIQFLSEVEEILVDNDLI